MKKDEYIASAVSKISNRKAKRELEAELEAHIDDLTELYLEQGFAQSEAEEKAVESMGDYLELSREMEQLYKGTGCFSRIIRFLLKTILMLLLLFLTYRACVLFYPIDCFNDSDVRAYTPSGINGRHRVEWAWTDIEEYWVFKLTDSQSEELSKDLTESYWAELNSSPLREYDWSVYGNVFKKQTDLTDNCYICVFDMYSKEFITDSTVNIIDKTDHWVIIIYDRTNEYYYCIHQSI